MSRVLALLVGLFVVWSSVPALAHDPIFFTPEQTSPELGPLLPDGTVSFALYGTLQAAGDTRGFQVRLNEGDRLLLELLIPDQPPETGLAPGELPLATVAGPDGRAVELAPELREQFSEPFTATRYVRLARLDAPAQAGVYDVTVTAGAPSRFTVAVGTRERFGTPVERVPNRQGAIATAAGPLREWYGAQPVTLAGEDDGGLPLGAVAAAALAGALVVLVVVRRRRWASRDG